MTVRRRGVRSFRLGFVTLAGLLAGGAALFAACAGPPASGPSDSGRGGASGAGGARAGSGGAAGAGSGGAASGATGGNAGAATGGSAGAASGTGGSGNPMMPGSDAGAPEVPAAVPGRVFTVGAVTTWRGGATAAYSLIHDDVCDDSVEGSFKHARPALKARGLRGGFGVIVKTCVDGDRWDDVKALAAEGHDVFDHSWSHPCMTTDPEDAQRCDPAAPKSANYAQEIDQSTKVLRESAGVPNLFFIFPYDVCAPAALAALKAQGYLGARCGDRMVALNASGFPDPFGVQFDVWGPAYSVYGQMAPCQGVEEYTTPPASTSPACRTAVLNRYVDDAIAGKSWAVREFHGFDDDKDTFEPLAVADYEAHLDYLKARADEGKLWVEGPTEVVKYRFAREKCAAPTVSDNKLSFGAPAADCRKYATRLSYTVMTSDDPATLSSFQGGKLWPARKTSARSFVVDADPTQGEAALQ